MPDSVVIRNTPFRYRDTMNHDLSFYAQDSWTHERLTVNGGIRARYRVVDPESRHSFRATNGSINVSVGPGAGGRVEARTVNGSIESDLPLESTSRATRRRLEGRLGKGSGSLQMSTVNGSIHLRKG